jgi:hypothetical protein
MHRPEDQQPDEGVQRMRPLLLGEAPSGAGDRYHAFPLSGHPSRLICKVMGWEVPTGSKPYWEVLQRFDTLNVVERYADAYPWSVMVARDRWACWRSMNRGPLVVVAVGRRAANAIGLGQGFLWGEWQAGTLLDPLLQATVIPHTSGRNYVWNDPGTAPLVRDTLTEALDRARIPEGTHA